MVTVINGSPNGLVPTQSVAYTQNTAGVPGTSERGDGFGSVIVAGSIASGQPYLRGGAPGEAIGDQVGAGSAYYLRGGTWRSFDQDTPEVAGSAEHWDGFGSTLTAGDRYFVVAAAGETLPGKDHAGQVHVFGHTIVDGVPDPLTTISQDSAGVSGSAEDDDGFGTDVSIVSYRPSASAPIGALVAVGVPNEDLGADGAAGMAHVLAVTPTGKFSELSDINQDTSGVADSTQRGDQFGYSVALAVNGSGGPATPTTALLAVGVPGEDLADGYDGALHVFRDMRSPGGGDLWWPNQTNAYDVWWHLGASATGVIPGDEYGSPVQEIPWTELLSG